MREYKSLKKIQSQIGKTYKYSVLVRLKNEEKYLPFFYDSLKKQESFQDGELIFLDSGSTDDSVSFLKTINCNIYIIESNDFYFGDSCNLLLSLSSTKINYFFSAHIVINSCNIFNETLPVINQKKNIAGLFFRQVPNEIVGYNEYESAYLLYRFPSQYWHRFFKSKVSFSNAASCVNKEIWEKIHFPDVIASEDLLWSKLCEKQNLKIIYFPSCSVRHSHNETVELIKNRVAINIAAQYPTGIKRSKSIFAFIKIFFSVFFLSFNIKKSFIFASAHFQGYLNNLKR